MEAWLCIDTLNQYIADLKKRTKSNDNTDSKMNTLMHERIEAAMQQLELYKQGKWRLITK